MGSSNIPLPAFLFFLLDDDLGGSGMACAPHASSKRLKPELILVLVVLPREKNRASGAG